MIHLKAIWSQLTSAYSKDTSLINDLWEEIEKNYSYKKRHYHSLQHLNYMMEKLKAYKNHLEEVDTITFSVFYHDIIYDPKKQHNEEKSAEVAHDRLMQLKVSPLQVEKCVQQIIATKSHQQREANDTNFLLDFDLAILGDTPEKYREYVAHIRKEYSIYPDFLYKRGRKKVLKHFLEMPEIFKTTEFVAAYEKQARINLSNELESL